VCRQKQSGLKESLPGNTIRPAISVSRNKNYLPIEINFKMIKIQFLATEEKSTIATAMKEISDKVCIEFKAKTSETSYISIKNSEEGCWAELGYRGKKQELNMDPDCFEDV